MSLWQKEKVDNNDKKRLHVREGEQENNTSTWNFQSDKTSLWQIPDHKYLFCPDSGTSFTSEYKLDKQRN